MECNKTPIEELVVNKLLDYNTDLRDLHRDMEFLKEFLGEYFEVEQKDIIVNGGRVTVVVDKIDIEMINKLSNIREKTNSISIEIKPFTRIPDRVGIDFIFKNGTEQKEHEQDEDNRTPREHQATIPTTSQTQ